jgi:hypothetical protein
MQSANSNTGASRDIESDDQTFHGLLNSSRVINTIFLLVHWSIHSSNELNGSAFRSHNLSSRGLCSEKRGIYRILCVDGSDNKYRSHSPRRRRVGEMEGGCVEYYTHHNHESIGAYYLLNPHSFM